MNTSAVPWFDLAALQAQRVGQLAWFLYGCAAREQRLNLDAWLSWWTGGMAATQFAAPGALRPGWPMADGA